MKRASAAATLMETFWPLSFAILRLFRTLNFCPQVEEGIRRAAENRGTTRKSFSPLLSLSVLIVRREQQPSQKDVRTFIVDLFRRPFTHCTFTLRLTSSLCRYAGTLLKLMPECVRVKRVQLCACVRKMEAEACLPAAALFGVFFVPILLRPAIVAVLIGNTATDDN